MTTLTVYTSSYTIVIGPEATPTLSVTDSAQSDSNRAEQKSLIETYPPDLQLEGPISAPPYSPSDYPSGYPSSLPSSISSDLTLVDPISDLPYAPID